MDRGEVIERHGPGYCVMCPGRDRCKTLCSEAEALAGQDEVIEDENICYGDIRNEDCPTRWSEGIPEEVWAIFDQVKPTEMQAQVFYERIFELRSLREIACKMGIDFMLADRTLKSIILKIINRKMGVK